MKSITVKLEIDQQFFDATKQFMEEKGVTIEQELAFTIKKCYTKYVPSAVRKYIEKSSNTPAPFLFSEPPAASENSDNK